VADTAGWRLARDLQPETPAQANASRRQQGNELVDSLMTLHCANLERLHRACSCLNDVRAAIARRLEEEVDTFRWSAQSSHYVKLGLERAADGAAVRRSYRRVSLLMHPDRNRGDSRAHDRTLMLNEAYETLSGGARLAYDRKTFGFDPVREGARQAGDAASSAASVTGFSFGSVSVDASGNIKIVLGGAR
jgi:hypothetical protein